MMFRYMLKSILLNKSLWGWGVAFMLFWLVMGAFVFSSSVPAQMALSYTSSYYGVISLYSFSAIAITISYTLFYGSYALAYSFKYTKLSPFGYFTSLLVASSVMATIMGAIMLFSTYALFSWKFGLSLLPHFLVASPVL